MTMVVDFADGFTSGTKPNLLGLGNEIFPIDNNQSAPVITDLNLTGYTSVFASYELERKLSSGAVFRQSGEITFSYDDSLLTWTYDLGNYRGLDLIKTDFIVNPEDVVLSINGAGDVCYQSGNIVGAGTYTGKLKMNLNRVQA